MASSGRGAETRPVRQIKIFSPNGRGACLASRSARLAAALAGGSPVAGPWKLPGLTMRACPGQTRVRIRNCRKGRYQERKRRTERESPYLQTSARAETRAVCRARGGGGREHVAGRRRGRRDSRVGRARPGGAGSGRVHRAGAAQRHPAREPPDPAERHRGQPQPGVRAAAHLPGDRLRRHFPCREGLVHPGGCFHLRRRGRPGRKLRAQAGQHRHLLPGVRADRPPDQPAAVAEPFRPGPSQLRGRAGLQPHPHRGPRAGRVPAGQVPAGRGGRPRGSSTLPRTARYRRTPYRPTRRSSTPCATAATS